MNKKHNVIPVQTETILNSVPSAGFGRVHGLDRS